MLSFIEEVDVTPVNLAVELERAVIEHWIDDDESIYVNEDSWHPYVLRILNGMGVIRFSTFVTFKSTVSSLQRLQFANELNSNHDLLTAHVSDDDCLYFDYALIFRDGLLRENFIRTCRQFPANIERGLKSVDPDGTFVSFPGEDEDVIES